ncbi:MAG TPA: DUF2784 domain-containing protein [Methylophilaceae bacterium]|nr:DUF2784 domain-containing protein [Methylophilaceae bacterium]
MVYRLLADGALVLHLLFIVFVVCGGLLTLRWPKAAWLHLPAASWGAFVELTGRLCPLTDWEVNFRQAAGQSGYTDSFIEHYLLPIIYPHELTREMQLILAGLVILVNVMIYGWGIYRWGHSRSGS